MTPGIESVNELDNLLNAAGKLRDFNVGALPVQNDQKELVGMLTDRDIITRAVAVDLDPKTTSIKKVMTKGIISCGADEPVERAVEMMEKHQVRRLVILENNQAAGILSLGDVAVKISNDELAGEAIDKISQSPAPAR